MMQISYNIKIKIIWILIFVSSNEFAQQQMPDTNFIKGKEQFEIGNYEKALAYFNEATTFNKNENSLNYMMGMAEYNLTQYHRAKKYFKKEIKANPKNTNAFLFKAKSKEKLNRNKSALKDLKHSLKIDSSNILTLIEKSNILYNQKKYTKAKQLYIKANKLSPTTEIIIYKLGFCEYYLNNTIEACNYWSKLEDLDDFENYEIILKTCHIKN